MVPLVVIALRFNFAEFSPFPLNMRLLFNLSLFTANYVRKEKNITV